MKDLMIEWRKFLQEEMKVIIGAAKDFICPPATQDLKLNTKNRDASIKAEHIQYGPLNVDEPGDYWKDIAKYWDTTEEAAKKSNCGNCIISNATLLALAEPGQRVDPLKKTAYPTNGRKETTSETSNEKVNDRVAELSKSSQSKREDL